MKDSMIKNEINVAILNIGQAKPCMEYEKIKN